MSFLKVNKNLMDKSFSRANMNKMQQFFKNKEKIDELEFEIGQQELYEFLNESYSTREQFEQDIDKIEYSQDLSIDFLNMAINFRISSDQVAEYMLEKQSNAILDFLFFPMVYLYRQSLELLLKAVYFQEISEENQRKNFISATHHNLYLIYEKIENLSIHSNKDKLGYIWLKKFLKNISIFDEKSDSFRYPFKFDKIDYGFEEITEAIPVFEERKDINLVLLCRKFIYAFILIQRLIREIPAGCNTISQGPNPDEVDRFINEPDLKTEFLEEGGPYKGKCVVGRDYIPMGFDQFATVYEECASFLYENYKESLRDGAIQNISAYHPMCYLLRNAIELSLKKLLTRSTSREEANYLIRSKKHNLLGLWNKIKLKFPSGPFCYLDSIPFQDQIEFYVTIMNLVDPTSSRFRYPANQNLEPYNSSPYRYHIGIHYHLLKTCFERISFTEYELDRLEENHEYPH